MFHKTIDAVRGAQAAAQAELDALLVPVEKDEYGRPIGGGFHWHAAASGILQNAIRGLDGLAAELEKRQAPIDEADAAAKQAEADAAKAAGSAPTDPTKLAPGEAWDATPGALAHAEKTGVDIGQVEGTGKGGTVTKSDVAAAAPAVEVKADA